MTPGLRTLTAAGAIAVSALLLPASADAQRRAVPRVVRSRPAVRAGVYYGPTIYRSWYASPYFWYDPFYYPYPYGFYYGQVYPPYYYGRGYDVSASLRLQVKPKQAEVFVDGYYAGTVDDFDGVFQRMYLEPGDHDLELYLAGHRSLHRQVYLQPGRTFTVRDTLEPLAPGDAEPPRPTPRAPVDAQARRAPRPAPIRPRGGARDGENGVPPATRSDFGSLALRVQPGDAAVKIDGESWDRSAENERLIVQLGTGVHNVQIEKDGYRTYSTDVTIRPGETTTLNVAMTSDR